jgi:tRNA threonylcarbamoyladenosine biosynthesis protein TsaE
MKSRRFASKGVGETRELAKTLAEEIVGDKGKKETVILGLVGELGSGKTTFTKAFVRALGIKKRTTSPTFLIQRRFRMTGDGKYKNIFHVDAYRLSQKEELKEIGMEETLKNPQNIVLVEWADRIKDVLPKSATWIKFEYGQEPNERNITVN